MRVGVVRTRARSGGWSPRRGAHFVAGRVGLEDGLVEALDAFGGLAVVVRAEETPREIGELGLEAARIVQEVAQGEEEVVLHGAHDLVDVGPIGARREHAFEGRARARTGLARPLPRGLDLGVDPRCVRGLHDRPPRLAQEDESRELVATLFFLGLRPGFGGGSAELAK